METEFKDLLKEFKKISNKRWIKCSTTNRSGVGLIFEKELKKSPDALYLPDYEGIEIKCSTRYSKYPLYLFTVAFDGPSFPEINRIVDLYGYPDKEFKDKNILYTKLNTNKKNIVRNKYKFKLKIEQEEGKIYLEVYDMHDNLIEKKSFIYIDSILNHLYIKLRNLAVIYAYKKKENDVNYFRYYKITFYKLKENFLELLDNDIICVDLIARVGKSGHDKGRYRNKNLVFSIEKENIEELFNKIYEYNHDNKPKYNPNFYILYY